MHKVAAIIHALLALACLAISVYMLITTRDLGWGAMAILLAVPGVAVFALCAWIHATKKTPAIVLIALLWLAAALLFAESRAFCLFMALFNAAPLVSGSGWRCVQAIPWSVGAAVYKAARKTPRWVPALLCLALVTLAGGYVWDQTAGFTLASFSDAELAGKPALMQGKTFREREISGLVLSDITISGATFDRVRFTNCHFTNVRFEGCTFINGGSAASSFNKVTFKDCAFKRYTSIFFLWENLYPPAMHSTRENALAWEYELHLRGDVLFQRCTGEQEQPNLYADEANIAIEDSTFTNATFGHLSPAKSLHARNSVLSGSFSAAGNVYIEQCDIQGYVKLYKGDLVMKNSIPLVRIGLEKGTAFLVNNTYRESGIQKPGRLTGNIPESLAVEMGGGGTLYLLGTKGEPVWLDLRDSIFPATSMRQVFLENITLKSLNMLEITGSLPVILARNLGPGIEPQWADIQAWEEAAPPVPHVADIVPVWR